MATRAAQQRMAKAKKPARKKSLSGGSKQSLYLWEGRDRTGKIVRGEIRISGQSMLRATLRRQGIRVTKVRKQQMSRGKKVTAKDITLFTRQLATMMRSGVPLLQALDIGIKGASNPGVSRLLNDVRADIEAGASLSDAFSRRPAYFDKLFCNLVKAGEQGGILDSLLDRLATYQEKMLAIKGKIKSAMFYPVAVLVIAVAVIAVMMIFVIPKFKEIFQGMGADLPAITEMVITFSDFMRANALYIFGGLAAVIVGTGYAYKRSAAMQNAMDRMLLQLPVLGEVIRKATIARWTRTLSTMFAAGVPLVEALDSVGGASGNYVYVTATKKIENEVSTGTSLTIAMQNADVFPTMVVQMVAIGEESGQLDTMLGKVADFFEEEVDQAVEALSSMIEPIMMVFLGGLIGFLVVAMYLPIFKVAGSMM